MLFANKPSQINKRWSIMGYGRQHAAEVSKARRVVACVLRALSECRFHQKNIKFVRIKNCKLFSGRTVCFASAQQLTAVFN